MGQENATEEHTIHQARLLLQTAELIVAKDPAAAREHLIEARRLDPKNVEILLTLGRVEVRLGVYTEAIQSLTRALQLGGPNAEGLAYMARSHVILKHFDEAGHASREALAIQPANVLAQECLIDCLIAGRRFEEALKESTKLSARCVLSEAGIARISRRNAICLFMLGDYVQVWQITSMLIESKRSDSITEKLHHQSEIKAKAEILKHTSELSWGARLFSKFFDSVVVSVFMKTHSARINSLQRKNTEAIRELKAHQEKTSTLERRAGEAERAAKTDELTGLPNLKCLNDDYLPRLGAVTGPVAVLAIDLDTFKLINDTHGHAGGDMVLKKMAQIASKWFRRPPNNCFRVGGEEFIALVYGGEEQALALAESFRLDLARSAAAELAQGGGLPLDGMVLQSLQDQELDDPTPTGWGLKAWDGTTHQLKDRLLTASIGLAFYPTDGRDFAELRGMADAACYAAKAGGRNMLVRWKAGMLGKKPGSPAPVAAAGAEVKQKKAELSGSAGTVVRRKKRTPGKRQADQGTDDGEHTATLNEILAGKIELKDTATAI